MSEIISILISCFFIGVFLSAPMGPIGILCVQRTLNNGRDSGFFTGVGAAASDLLYCMLTGLAMSFVDDYIKGNQDLLQLVGSVILLIYGIYLIRRNPVTQLKPATTDKKALMRKDMVSGFLLTLSNPLIVLLVVPLFTRFNFPAPEFLFYHHVIGYVFIVVGALSWWAVITYSINAVRSHFNIRSMWLLNRMLGGVILAVAAYGVYTAILAFTQTS